MHRLQRDNARTVGPVLICAWLVALMMMLGVDAGAARAQVAEADEELTGIAALVELPGECGSGAPLEPGLSIDCRFAIRPGASINDVELTASSGDYTRCSVEATSAMVRCQGLLGERYEQGTVAFDLFIDGMIEEDAASITTVWNADPGFSFSTSGIGELVVFDGRPLRWFSYVYEPLDGLFVTIRGRDGGDILQTVQLPVNEPFVSTEGSFEPDLPIGRYRLWPCVGATADTCVEQPGGQPFQVINGELIELIDGHNRPSADRINVVFVGSGLSELVDGRRTLDLPSLAIDLLTIEGPTGVGDDGGPVDVGEPAQRLVWGPLATEPLASNIDRFNFWYIEDDIADEEGVLFGGTEPVGDIGFALPHVQITALHHDDRRPLSDSRGTSFETLRTAIGEAKPRSSTFSACQSRTRLA